MPGTETKRDYYEVLGVARTATRDDIKHAYRQMALQYHPDKNKDPEAAAKFRELAEAYAVLSDDTKRKEYDTTGHAGVSERWSQDDLMRDFQFGDFFGGRFGDLSGIFGDFFGRRARPGVGGTRGIDLRYDLDLTLEEAARGGVRDIRITRSEKCVPCGGTGAKAGTKPLSCPECKGTGQKQEVRTRKDVRLVTLITCARCQGRGHIVESACPLCEGNGYQFIPHMLKVRIPPGVDDGMMIRLSGQGEANVNGGPPGDLLIRPHIRPHPTLERRGDNLFTVQTVTFPDAALGKKLRVTGLGEDLLQVMMPAGTQSGTTLRVKGKGMPKFGAKGKGDLFVVVEVRTPTDLTEHERELLQELARLQQDRGTA
ncbi:MAG TPA: J domain-containing protein [Nitrospira sp.]|jgi:molecular chaperone DnaJ|nr:J domain-containing protein [Nitrospira sp.]